MACWFPISLVHFTALFLYGFIFFKLGGGERHFALTTFFFFKKKVHISRLLIQFRLRFASEFFPLGLLFLLLLLLSHLFFFRLRLQIPLCLTTQISTTYNFELATTPPSRLKKWSSKTPTAGFSTVNSSSHPPKSHRKPDPWSGKPASSPAPTQL